jgi:hypothetical protein
MNRIINWLLLIIIFVFDPLAIALVIAANFAFNQLRSKEGYDMYKDTPLEEQVEDNEGTDIYTETELEELKDWDVTLNDGLEDEKQPNNPEPEPVRLEDDKLLNNSGISSWRKKKLRDYLDGNTKTYF